MTLPSDTSAVELGDPNDVAWGLSKDDLERLKLQAEIQRLNLQCRDITLDLQHSEIALGERRTASRENAADGLRHRRFTFYGPVIDASAAYCMKVVGEMARQSTGPIEVMFCSPGGHITDGLAIYDYLRYLSGRGNPITTVALGMAASMGAVLMQAGDHRVMGRHAHLLIHEASAGAVGNAVSTAIIDASSSDQ